MRRARDCVNTGGLALAGTRESICSQGECRESRGELFEGFKSHHTEKEENKK